MKGAATERILAANANVVASHNEFRRLVDAGASADQLLKCLDEQLEALLDLGVLLAAHKHEIAAVRHQLLDRVNGVLMCVQLGAELLLRDRPAPRDPASVQPLFNAVSKGRSAVAEMADSLARLADTSAGGFLPYEKTSVW